MAVLTITMRGTVSLDIREDTRAEIVVAETEHAEAEGGLGACVDHRSNRLPPAESLAHTAGNRNGYGSGININKTAANGIGKVARKSRLHSSRSRSILFISGATSHAKIKKTPKKWDSKNKGMRAIGLCA